MYDILLKNAFVVDPSQGINKKTSIAIREGRIAAIDEKLSEEESLSTFELGGKIVTPGLIDIHCHVDSDFSFLGLPADDIGINAGVTLLCDAGTSGCANFPMFRKNMENSKSKSDIFCFLNFGRTGLIGIPEICSDIDIDFEKSRAVIEENRDIIKGVKVRITEHLAEGIGFPAIEKAKKLADAVGMPLMVHIGETRPRKGLKDPLDDLSRATLGLMEKGDILSHYVTWEPGGVILADGTIYPELEPAWKRGVVLDPCHGLNHFCFNTARHAIESGLIPTVISTDMATIVKPSAQSMPVVMSKFLMLGLTLEQVVEMATINPARTLGEEDKRGSLKPGRIADITVIELKQGQFPFMDHRGGSVMTGEVLLEPYMVLKTGRPFPAWSRYHLPRRDLVEAKI